MLLPGDRGKAGHTPGGALQITRESAKYCRTGPPPRPGLIFLMITDKSLLQESRSDNRSIRALRALKKKMQREGVNSENEAPPNTRNPRSGGSRRKRPQALLRYRKLLRKRLERGGLLSPATPLRAHALRAIGGFR